MNNVTSTTTTGTTTVATTTAAPTAMTSDEVMAWLRLMHVPGIRDGYAQKLLRAFGLPEHIFEQSRMSLGKVLDEKRVAALMQPISDELLALHHKTMLWLESPQNELIPLGHALYPNMLLSISDPPTLLYAKGNFDLLHRSAIAMVGSRSASNQGLENAFAFAHDLSLSGFTVVSGLALGVDIKAHQGALAAVKKNSAAGSTIAVIGTGCDLIYPAAHREWAHEIAEHGLILSEFELGTKAMTHHFPRRNRMISGLSHGVLVVEAALKSGSLITASQALEQNREVFAIPGSIHSPHSKGCHWLIKQGAKLVESGHDILHEIKGVLFQQDAEMTHLDPMVVKAFQKHQLKRPSIKLNQDDSFEMANHARTKARTKAEGDEALSTGQSVDHLAAQNPSQNNPHPKHFIPPSDLSDVQQHILQALGFEPCDVDLLVNRTQIDVGDLIGELMMLELGGVVVKLAGNNYQRVVS